MNYLKDPETGNIYLESLNPQGVWTPEEWEAEIKAREDKLVELLANQPQPKTVPDQESLDLWNSMIPQPPEQINLLESELAEMKAV